MFQDDRALATAPIVTVLSVVGVLSNPKSSNASLPTATNGCTMLVLSNNTFRKNASSALWINPVARLMLNSFNVIVWLEIDFLNLCRQK